MDTERLQHRLLELLVASMAKLSDVLLAVCTRPDQIAQRLAGYLNSLRASAVVRARYVDELLDGQGRARRGAGISWEGLCCT